MTIQLPSGTDFGVVFNLLVNGSSTTINVYLLKNNVTPMSAPKAPKIVMDITFFDHNLISFLNSNTSLNHTNYKHVIHMVASKYAVLHSLESCPHVSKPIVPTL